MRRFLFIYIYIYINIYILYIYICEFVLCFQHNSSIEPILDKLHCICFGTYPCYFPQKRQRLFLCKTGNYNRHIKAAG